MSTLYTVARDEAGLDSPDAVRSTTLTSACESVVDSTSADWDGPWPEHGQTVRGVIRWRSRRLPLAILSPDMHITAYARAEALR